MPITQTITPDYPDVPNAPGVPPVLRRAGEVENAVVQLIADAAQVVSMFKAFGPQWGIFDKNGQPVLRADSVISVDYRNEWQIAKHPIEGGGFQDFNKVKIPFDVRVVFAVSGQQSLIPGSAVMSVIGGNSQQEARRESLAMLDRAMERLDTVTVVTPEATYPSVNLTHYDYRREARSGGASLIRVEVWCEEIRISADPIFDKSGEPAGTVPHGTSGTGGTGGENLPANGGANAPSQPEGASPTSGGTVSPQQVGPGDGAGTTTSQSLDSGGGAPSNANFDVGGATGSTKLVAGEVPIYDVNGNRVPGIGSATAERAGEPMGSYLNRMSTNGYTANYQSGNIVSYTKH